MMLSGRVTCLMGLFVLAAVIGPLASSARADVDPANGVDYSSYEIHPGAVLGGARGAFFPYIYDENGTPYLPGDAGPANRHYRIAYERNLSDGGEGWQIFTADLVRAVSGGWAFQVETCISCADAAKNGGYNGLPDVARVPIYDRESGLVAQYDDRIVYLSTREWDPGTIGSPGGGSGQNIYVMDVDGSNVRPVTQDFVTTNNYHARFSPTGRYILWSSAYYDAERPFYWDVRIAEYREYTDGTYEISGETRIVEPDDGAWYETHGFDPGETRVYVSTTTDTSGNSEEWAISLSSVFVDGKLPGGRHPVPYSERIRLTNNHWWDEHVAASPTGNKIAFISSRQRTSLSNLYNEAMHMGGASPAADWFLVIPYTVMSWVQPVMRMNTDYVLADPDGSHPVVLGPEDHNHISAKSAWSPDGYLLLGDWRGEEERPGESVIWQLVVYEFEKEDI